MTSTADLPSPDALFQRFCRPWYSPADLVRRTHATTRPDIEVGVAPPRTPVTRLHTAPLEVRHYVRMAHEAVLAQAVEALPRELGVTGAPTADWLDAFDRAYPPSRVAALIATSDDHRRDNAYVVTAARLAALLGRLLLERLPRGAWLLESPSWESAIYDHRSSSRANVFHWAVRRLSAEGVGHSLRATLDDAVEALAQAAARAAAGEDEGH